MAKEKRPMFGLFNIPSASERQARQQEKEKVYREAYEKARRSHTQSMARASFRRTLASQQQRQKQYERFSGAVASGSFARYRDDDPFWLRGPVQQVPAQARRKKVVVYVE